VRATGSARLLLVVISAVVALVVIVAIVIIDPPAQRLRSLDSRRTDDLGSLQRGIELYWNEHKSLPAGLAELVRERELGPLPTDPETGASYEYEPVGESTYRLCANFALDTREEGTRGSSYPDQWAHGSGRQCLERTVNEP